jgi:hypothetical protein
MKNMFKKIEKGLLITLAIVLVVGFLTMPAQECPGDAIAARIETVSLINSKQFGVPGEIASQFGDRGQFFYNNEKTGAWYSKYGILNSLIYVPALALEKYITGRLEFSNPSRILVLNIHNLVLSLFFAGFLYSTAKLFVTSQSTSAVFTVAVIYTTFCWNHLRVNNFEIHQTLFMTGATYYAVRVMRSIRVNDNLRSTRLAMLLTALFLAALILCKSVYVLILPLFAIAVAWPMISNYCRSDKNQSKIFREFILWFFIPLSVGFLILLLVNDLRFGSPLNNGYTQWVREREPFSGDFLHGFWGFLFNTQFGIFTCFPVLLIALFYWREFISRFSVECALILAVSAVILITYSFYIRWTGGWCYGPRYLLPVLPLLSLPFLLAIENLIKRPFNFNKGISLAGIFTLLGISLYMQVMVNSLPFFIWWNMREGLFANANRLEANEYLDGIPFGLINADLKAFKNGKKFPPLEALRNELTEDQYTRFEELLRGMSVSNYYWFR